MVQGCICQETRGPGVPGLHEFTAEDFRSAFTDQIEQVEKQTTVADLLVDLELPGGLPATAHPRLPAL